MHQKRAHIYDFIKSYPSSFETFVGERGINLSGGQKQEIGLAELFTKIRILLTFLMKPQVLF